MTPMGVFPHCPAPTCISFPSFRLPWIKKKSTEECTAQPSRVGGCLHSFSILFISFWRGAVGVFLLCSLFPRLNLRRLEWRRWGGWLSVTSFQHVWIHTRCWRSQHCIQEKNNNQVFRGKCLCTSDGFCAVWKLWPRSVSNHPSDSV